MDETSEKCSFRGLLQSLRLLLVQQARGEARLDPVARLHLADARRHVVDVRVADPDAGLQGALNLQFANDLQGFCFFCRYVFCYPCIYSYIKKHKRCPVTRYPTELAHLVKIYPPDR